MGWSVFFFFKYRNNESRRFQEDSQLPELFPPVVLCVLFLNPLLQCTSLGSAETQGLLGFYVEKKPIEVVVVVVFASSSRVHSIMLAFFFSFNFSTSKCKTTYFVIFLKDDFV